MPANLFEFRCKCKGDKKWSEWFDIYSDSTMHAALLDSGLLTDSLDPPRPLFRVLEGHALRAKFQYRLKETNGDS